MTEQLGLDAPVELAVSRDDWYAGLENGLATRARQAADSIKARMQRTAEEIIGAGQELSEIKQALPHGKWGEWLRLEFGMSERSAQRFMSVAERFADKSDTVSFLPARVLYALAAPSTPDVVVDAAMGMATDGQPLTEDDVTDLKRADAELKEESPLLHTHDAGDVAQRAASNRAREDAVRREAERPSSPPAKPAEPLPLACPTCESLELWVVERPARGNSVNLQCKDCHHRFWSSHKDAAALPDRPKLEMALPPEPEPEPPVIVVTVRIQPPSEPGSERRCIVAIGAEGEMPQMSSTTYGQVLDVLEGLLEEYVGRVEPVGEFIDVEVA